MVNGVSATFQTRGKVRVPIRGIKWKLGVVLRHLA